MSNRIKDVLARFYRPPQGRRQALALSRADAEKIAEQLQAVPGVALISITAPERPEASLGHFEHLHRLSFADVDFLSEDLSDRAKKKLEHAMTEGQAAEILSFVNGLPDDVHTILIHCEGGFSRSCGVVVALHDLYQYQVEHERLADANRSVTEMLKRVNAGRKSGKKKNRSPD